MRKTVVTTQKYLDDLEAENARLRENYDAAVGEAEAQAAEVARLRDLVALNGREVLRLREALEEIARRSESFSEIPWYVTIARNALKETT